MALMFSRIARNFIKNGYFPTDEDTLSRILTALSVESDQSVRILDPCCGEGVALAEIHRHLGELGASSSAYGIEYDEERAWQAKQLLDRCIHADLNDCSVGLRRFSLLFLNPPYGDLVSDSERAFTRRDGGRKRLEKMFARRCFPMLQPGGVLVLIVPYSVLDREFGTLISRNFRDVTVHAAPEQKFRQAVIFGVKRPRVADADKRVVMQIAKAQLNQYQNTEGDWVEGFSTAAILPEVWSGEPYLVPSLKDRGEVPFHSVRIDQRQLSEEIERNPALWDRFVLLFRSDAQTHRQPLRALSEWHLALLLAAGQVSGVVEGQSGKVFLVKGDTHKAKSERNESSLDEETGAVTLTRIATDRFVPLIRAIDFTPGSATFGRIMHIE